VLPVIFLNPTIMKKHFFLTVISITFFLFSKSQNKAFEYGLHGGLNLNSAYGTAINKDYKHFLLEFNVGGHIKINTSNRFGIKAILQYEQNGWAYRSLTFENNSGTALGKGDVLFKLNYLTLPVLAEYSFGNKVKVITSAGVFFRVLLNNQIITKIKEPVPPNESTTTKSKSDYRKSTNFGIPFGAGVQVPFSSKLKLDVNILDNYGLLNINKPTGSSTNTTIKTNSLSLSFGIIFTL
jgi:opacity protein-like surface antigen